MTKNLHRHLRSFQFIQNSNQMASRLTAITSFPRILFQLLQFSRQGQSFSAYRAALMTKADLIFPTFSLRFTDFAVQFCFRCKFSFHEKRRSSQVWQWRDFSPPITILCYTSVTNEIASFCIDHRLRQMAFFSSLPKWAEAGFSVMLKYFEINKSIWSGNLFRYYINQIDSMLPCVCSVIDHRRRQNVVRTSVTHSAIASCATFLFLPHFDVIEIFFSMRPIFVRNSIFF